MTRHEWFGRMRFACILASVAPGCMLGVITGWLMQHYGFWCVLVIPFVSELCAMGMVPMLDLALDAQRFCDRKAEQDSLDEDL